MARNRNKTTISYADRLAVIGSTGSGKTYAMTRLLSRLAVETYHPQRGLAIPIYILDPKFEPDFEPFFSKGVGILHENPPPPHDPLEKGVFAVWRPSYDDKGTYEQWFHDIFQHHKNNRLPGLVYVDEMGSITGQTGFAPRYYDTILRQGRSIGLGCISATQSSTYLPHPLLRQASHVFMFRTQHPNDQKKLEPYLGRHEVYKPFADDYGFLMRDIRRPMHKNPTSYYSSIQQMGI